VRRLHGILRDGCCFVLKSLIAGTARETVSGRASVVAHTRSIQSIDGPRSRTIARTAVISIKQERAVIAIAALDGNRLFGLRFPGLSCGRLRHHPGDGKTAAKDIDGTTTSRPGNRRVRILLLQRRDAFSDFHGASQTPKTLQRSNVFK